MLRKTESRLVKLDNIMELKDRVTYTQISRILDNKEALVYLSEDNDFIAGQIKGKPMWIWSNNVVKINEIKGYIGEFINIIDPSNVPNIMGNYELINKIKRELNKGNKCSWELDMDMTAYYCEKVNHSFNGTTRLEKPNEDHVELIAGFITGLIRDVYGEVVSVQEQIEAAKQSINSGKLYILVKGSEVVSMANIGYRSQSFGMINLVYTPDEHRKNGYASDLVAMLSQLILDEDRFPMLYTDDSNETSNKIYMNIGYKETGRIKNIKLSAITKDK